MFAFNYIKSTVQSLVGYYNSSKEDLAIAESYYNEALLYANDSLKEHKATVIAQAATSLELTKVIEPTDIITQAVLNKLLLKNYMLLSAAGNYSLEKHELLDNGLSLAQELKDKNAVTHFYYHKLYIMHLQTPPLQHEEKLKAHLKKFAALFEKAKNHHPEFPIFAYQGSLFNIKNTLVQTPYSREWEASLKNLNESIFAFKIMIEECKRSGQNIYPELPIYYDKDELESLLFQIPNDLTDITSQINEYVYDKTQALNLKLMEEMSKLCDLQAEILTRQKSNPKSIAQILMLRGKLAELQRKKDAPCLEEKKPVEKFPVVLDTPAEKYKKIEAKVHSNLQEGVTELKDFIKTFALTQEAFVKILVLKSYILVGHAEENELTFQSGAKYASDLKETDVESHFYVSLSTLYYKRAQINFEKKDHKNAELNLSKGLEFIQKASRKKTRVFLFKIARIIISQPKSIAGTSSRPRLENAM